MKKVLKRVLSVLLCVIMLFNFSLTVFAVPSWVVAIGTFLLEKLKDLAWDYVVDILKNGSLDSLEILECKSKFIAEMREYALSNNLDYDSMLDYLGFLYAEWDSSNIDTYGDNASEVWNKYHDVIYKLCSVYYTTDIAELAKLITDPSVDAPAITDDGTVSVPSSDFVDFIDEQNTQFTPKNVIGKMSYRTDERFQSVTNSYKYYNGYSAMDLYCGNFLATGDEQDIYIMFFASTADKSYYGQYQYHFMIRQNDVEHWYEDRDEFMCYGSTLSVEYWDMINGSQETAVSKVIISDFVPCALILDFYSHLIVQFNNLTDFYPYYTTNKYHGYNGSGDFVNSSNVSDYDILYDVSDFPLTSVDGYTTFCSHFKKDFTEHDSKCEYGGGDDFGYIASTTPISTTYNIDTKKIPANQVINITGDTIYDYSITNPDTGESTTINNYITNNYTYPVVDTPSDPSGGTGGDVTVGGNINVGGEVGVDITVSVPDININVNQGSGAGGSGSGINPDDILDGSSVDLDKYYDDAVSQASGVRNFLGEFFSFLPAELVGLICMLVAVAIVCRIFGR